MKKTELIEKLETVKSVASAFLSVDDVIKMVEELEDSFSGELAEELDELASNIANEICNGGMDLVENYDLSMNYREVELDSLTLDESAINEMILNTIRDHFEK